MVRIVIFTDVLLAVAQMHIKILLVDTLTGEAVYLFGPYKSPQYWRFTPFWHLSRSIENPYHADVPTSQHGRNFETRQS